MQSIYRDNLDPSWLVRERALGRSRLTIMHRWPLHRDATWTTYSDKPRNTDRGTELQSFLTDQLGHQALKFVVKLGKETVFSASLWRTQGSLALNRALNLQSGWLLSVGVPQTFHLHCILHLHYQQQAQFTLSANTIWKGHTIYILNLFVKQKTDKNISSSLHPAPASASKLFSASKNTTLKTQW